MTADRSVQLSADGFELIKTFRVGVVHFVWRVDLDMEFDRALRLVEETVLRLVDAGVGDPNVVAQLMGLDDAKIVPGTVVDLLRDGALRHRDGRLEVTPLGAEQLKKASRKETHTYTDVELRHDPYRDELMWSFDEEEYKQEELRGAGIRALPQPAELSNAALEGRHREVQALVDRLGLPFDRDEEQKSRRREIIRLRPIRVYVAYRDGELEAWYHAVKNEWNWRLLRAGGEEREVSEKLAALEAGGATIIPLEDRREDVVSPAGTEVHAAVQEAQRVATPAVLQTSEHRDALRDAIGDAKTELIIVSPWLRTAAVDSELIGWLSNALDRAKELRVTIGYGIERTPGKQTEQARRDQEEALHRLRKLSDRTSGRLRIVDVGNTHEKVVICDDRYAIITSFNFLSFNPGTGGGKGPVKGIRREMGYRITDVAVVEQVRRRIIAALGR